MSLLAHWLGPIWRPRPYPGRHAVRRRPAPDRGRPLLVFPDRVIALA